MIGGMPSDIERVTKPATEAGIPVAQPTPLFTEFVSVLRAFDLVLSSDTATVHAASALGIPTVAVYASPVSAALWRPWSVPYVSLIGDPDVSSVSPGQIVTAATSLLGPNHGTVREAS
jgi:ADP-heptose:LPS heptosyltransferase